MGNEEIRTSGGEWKSPTIGDLKEMVLNGFALFEERSGQAFDRFAEGVFEIGGVTVSMTCFRGGDDGWIEVSELFRSNLDQNTTVEGPKYIIQADINGSYEPNSLAEKTRCGVFLAYKDERGRKKEKRLEQDDVYGRKLIDLITQNK